MWLVRSAVGKFGLATNVEPEFLGPVMVQLDGDVIDSAGLRQFHISVLPGAIRLRVPQTPTR